MYKLYLVYNGTTNLDVNLFIQNRVSKPSPIRQYEEKEVPGKEGMLYIDKGYEDIEIPVSFNFASKDKNEWDSHWRIIKKWLNKKGDSILKFSDDLEYYYIVKKINIDTPERVLKRIGRFNVTFTCEPYCYRTDGLEEITLPSYLFNSYKETFPVFKIKGEGLLNLVINNNVIKVNVGQDLTIDVKKGLCYRTDDGEIMNTSITAFYDDMKLLEGDNTFSYPSNFDIKIIPNWRCE